MSIDKISNKKLEEIYYEMTSLIKLYEELFSLEVVLLNYVNVKKGELEEGNLFDLVKGEMRKRKILLDYEEQIRNLQAEKMTLSQEKNILEALLEKNNIEYSL